MADLVASYTPLAVRWPHALGRLASRISIVDRPTFDEKEWQKIFNLRAREQKVVLESPHWLMAEAECPPDRHGASLLSATTEDVRSAMLGFQIWCPKGWTGIIVNARRRENDTLGVESVSFPEGYAQSRWAHGLRLDDKPQDELGAIIQGTLTALKSNSVPNPRTRLARLQPIFTGYGTRLPMATAFARRFLRKAGSGSNQTRFRDSISTSGRINRYSVKLHYSPSARHFAG
jgi:hypothetical protein